MQIRIEDPILKKYPLMEIGYLVATVKVKKTDPFVEDLKQSLAEKLKELGIQATNFVVHPQVAVWRKIYREDFQVKESTYRSSLEALVRRVVTGKALWNICNVVDLYNCCSILSLLPMGGYDLSKISGDIEIRYAQEGELFHGIGEKLKIKTQSHHVVYADDQKVTCWLWNHKDAYETCIDDNTREVIFFIDSVEGFGSHVIQDALDQLAVNLEKIECCSTSSGVLNAHSPHATLSIQKGG
jgi:lysyl-tRNA synthetase class 2